MNSSFGDRLRLQRERRQIALSTIADQTKIKLSLLEALERDDLSHWPLGIFGRSYIRAYAQAVGLEPDATVREFIERHPASTGATPAVLSDVREMTPEKSNRRPPTRIEVLIDSAIDAFHARRAEQNPRPQSPKEPPPTLSPGLAYSESVTARPRAQAVPEPEPQRPNASPTLFELQPVAVDMTSVAQLCTRLGCAQEAHEVTTALEEAAELLDAVGVILWMPDSLGMTLTPVFAHGYPDEVIAYSTRLSTDADNATADAFRRHTLCLVESSAAGRTGAIVAPLLTPMGCAGALAVELRSGSERREDVRAAITILAAQLSTLMGFSVLAHTLSA
jgi:hypothetical protein